MSIPVTPISKNLIIVANLQCETVNAIHGPTNSYVNTFAHNQ